MRLPAPASRAAAGTAAIARRCALGVQGCGVSGCGVSNASLNPLAHISFRCEVPRPSVFESQSTTIFKLHILKRHIPGLPSASAPAGRS